MNIFGEITSFFKNRRQRAIAKSMKVALNPKSIADERMSSLQYIASIDEGQTTVPILLRRFDFAIENGIADAREKEVAKEGILRHAPEALTFLREHIRTTTRIAWPIKIFEEMAGEEELSVLLGECLFFEDYEFDQDKVDKNYDLLCYLRDFNLTEEVCCKLLKLLDAHDERVRSSTVDVLLAQPYTFIPAALEKFICDASSENTRIRRSVSEAFAAQKWVIQDPEFITKRGLPEGGYINEARQLVL